MQASPSGSVFSNNHAADHIPDAATCCGVAAALCSALRV